MTEIRCDKIVIGGTVSDGFVYFENGKIAAVTERERLAADTVYDFRGLYLAPGFVDIHTHGAGGFPFIDNTVDDVIGGCDFHLKHGTTSILPTVTAGPFSAMERAVQNIAEAKRSGRMRANIVGAHLEGPYLSSEQCGAQCPSFITRPIAEDYGKLLCEYGDVVKRWTYAPEKDPDGVFCRFLTSRGVIASAGHTNAKYGEMRTAIENGCNLVTHLYSCTSTVTRSGGFRSLGVVESAFLRDELSVEIIADGKHLPAELIQMIVKIKGADKVVACTDSLSIAGTGIGEGVMSGTAFVVEDGVCKLRDRSAFAGSVAMGDDLLRMLVKACGFSVPLAVKMLSENPSELLKIKKGRIEEGFDADFTAFDEDMIVRKVFAGGEPVIF